MAEGTQIITISNQSQGTYWGDWWLVSKDELDMMFDLVALGKGGFKATGETRYWSSTESSATHAKCQDFVTGVQSTATKGTLLNVRACHEISGTTDIYAVGDDGPAGGWIFNVEDNLDGTFTYLECAEIDQSNGYHWSNITNSAVTNLHDEFQEGGTNTILIIAQAGHTDSAALICFNYYAQDSTAISGSLIITLTNQTELPAVSTLPVTAITSTTATSGGIVIDAGGGTVSARGVCWRTSPNPNTSSDKTTDGTGVGGFASFLSGLTENTTYYVRAYATNENGTSYGPNVSFQTGQTIIAIPRHVGNIPTFRFYVSTASSVTREVFPLGFLSTTLIDELDKDNIFYRRKFNGTLLFGTNSLVIDDDSITQNRKDDWSYFWDMEQNSPCEVLYLDIHRIVSGVTEEYWTGLFSTTDGNFDIDKCTFEVSPLSNDDYVPIFDAADIQYNILDVVTHITTRAVQGELDVTYTRNRWLFDVIEFLADKVLPGVTVSSDFFTDATNYVTLHANHLNYLTIAQKSDIIRPLSTDPATSAMMSWNELMAILWTMFQVKWDYDGVINVEHISWWSAGVGLNLTAQASCVAMNKYSYVKEKMPKYEKFSFMEADESNFVGVPISYSAACVDQNPDTNVKDSVITVTTDLEYIILNPDAISDDGFIMLCNYENGGDYFVEIEAAKYGSSVRLNMHLSWTNLHDRYFRHNRVLINGSLYGPYMTFWTAQKTKLQTLSAIICANSGYDPADEITTELGETYLSGAKARVKSAVLHPSGLVDFNLLYGPADNVPTEIEDDKWILIYETDCGEFSAVLSEAADDDLDIVIKYIIFDSDMTVVCSDTVSGETWTIPDTSTSDTYALSLCAPVPAGGCIRYVNEFEVTGRADWKVGFIGKCNCE